MPARFCTFSHASEKRPLGAWAESASFQQETQCALHRERLPPDCPASPFVTANPSPGTPILQQPPSPLMLAIPVCGRASHSQKPNAPLRSEYLGNLGQARQLLDMARIYGLFVCPVSLVLAITSSTLTAHQRAPEDLCSPSHCCIAISTRQTPHRSPYVAFVTVYFRPPVRSSLSHLSLVSAFNS